MDADENVVLVVRLCRIEFYFDDSKWWCSPRSLLIDTNHFCGRCPRRFEISASLRLCVRLLLTIWKAMLKRIFRTQSHRDAEVGQQTAVKDVFLNLKSSFCRKEPLAHVLANLAQNSLYKTIITKSPSQNNGRQKQHRYRWKRNCKLLGHQPIHCFVKLAVKLFSCETLVFVYFVSFADVTYAPCGLAPLR